MSNAKGDNSGETIYLRNNNGKDDSGDDSAGETSYLTNDGKGPNPAWIAVLGNFLGQLISTKLDQALEGRIPVALPQPSQQAATSEQPPSLQPASTNAQGIIQPQPHQHLPPQHCQGGSAAASGGSQHPA